MSRKRNPKSKADLTAALKELRDWTRIEAGLDPVNSKAWCDVFDWSIGMAVKHKLNLDETQEK